MPTMNDESVAVAVSGGADSLYSLLRLRDSGAGVFALHALFLPERLRPPFHARLLEDLRKVCAGLGVDLHIVDCSKSFEDLVIRPFIRDYAAGLTPNPCAGCNRDLKFGLLQEEAAKLGASRLATGHYARLLQLDGGPALFAGADKSKDQSYFLALTPVSRLASAVFPAGGMLKKDVLAELELRGKEVPQKTESQEICFIIDNDYRAFLRREAEGAGFRLSPPGPVALPGGRVIAKHKGLWAYTEGQRRGLGIAWSAPLHVLAKDPASNTLIVGTREDFQRQGCLCGKLNFLVPLRLWPETVLAKTRYRQEPRPARVFPRPPDSAPDAAFTLRLEFEDAAGAPPSAPGQVAAIYAPSENENGPRLLAGGVILPPVAAP